MTRVLLADGVVAGRPYVLAVGLHALGVWLPRAPGSPEAVAVVLCPSRTADEVLCAVAVVRALDLVRAGVRPA